VTEYNTYRQSFPPLLIANATGHTVDRELLNFDAEPINEVPKVSFN
jgi:LemA protein